MLNLQWLLLLLLVGFAFPPCVSSSTSASDFDSNTRYLSEWKILTKQNFSSQIRSHPHIMLLITLPWLGESRALMRDVARAVNQNNPDFSSLKLMVMYRTTEKVLADALGATDEINILYFHHSKSYNYRGRLRVQNILTSVRPHLLLPPEDLPVKYLTSPRELRAFLDSTDKAALLLEFCGWTPELQRRGWKNATEHGFYSQGDAGLTGNANANPGMFSSMQCSIGDEASGIPWWKFGLMTNPASLGFEEARDFTGFSCNFQEFQLFESFFLTFMTVARELFLPPERHKFGVVAERSLLPFLDVEEPNSWSVMVHYSGCPSCSMTTRDAEDFKNSMQIDNSLVTELEASGHTQQLTLPSDKPSVLLIIDRSSELSEDRVKSGEALNALRELALHSQISHRVHGKMPVKVGNMAALSHESQGRSMLRHPYLKLSSSPKFKTKDKTSIMILDEQKEKHVSLDAGLSKNSLHEILNYLLQQKEEGKLSVLAKKMGFQLLSDDVEIKIVSPSSGKEVQVMQAQEKVSPESGIIDSHKDDDKFSNGHSASYVLQGETSTTEDEGISKLMDPEPSQYDGDRASTSDRSENVLTESEQLDATGATFTDLEDIIPESMDSLKADKLKDEVLQIERFRGTFYFCDGDYRLLRAMTGDSKIPSLVIVDPVRQQHYIYPAHRNFTFGDLGQFLGEYLNSSFLPYQQSESTLSIPKESSRPPFINLDFHETDAIPKITTRTLSEIIFGMNQSLSESVTHHPQKDIVVLFKNEWCGFCQRMVLVVREVHRALKGYIKTVKNVLFEKTSSSGDSMEDISQKLPVIYMLDCTFNDCSLLFETIDKEEVYPALVLFPVGNRSPISYEGEAVVSSVINFMVEHGTHSHHLINENGTPWTPAGNEGSATQAYFEDRSADTVQIHNPGMKDELHEVLANSIPEKISSYRDSVKPLDFKGVEESEEAPHVGVGSILHATAKLAGAQIFEESAVLIVKADRYTGFQGLMINKHISWDSLRKLDGGSEVLREAPLSFGGPLAVRELPLVALTRKAMKDHQVPEVLPGLYFVDQWGTASLMKKLKSGTAISVADYWFFFGYAGWTWDQLFNEIAEGSWTASKDDILWPTDR